MIYRTGLLFQVAGVAGEKLESGNGIDNQEERMYTIRTLRNGGSSMPRVSGITAAKHLVLFIGYLEWEARKQHGRRLNSWG